MRMTAKKLSFFCQALVLAFCMAGQPVLTDTVFAAGASERPAGLSRSFDIGPSDPAPAPRQQRFSTPERPAPVAPRFQPGPLSPPAPQSPRGPLAPADYRPPSVDTVGPAPAPVPDIDESQTAAAAARKAGNSSGGPQKILIFNTVAFRNSRALPDWESMLERNRQSPIFRAGIKFNKSTDWPKLRAHCSGKHGLDLLRAVNSFWNGFRYVEDSRNWGKPDYWACPAEFLRKSGDCEDYAIVKYFTLKELGISVDRMRIVVLKDTIRNLAHAVLVVFIGEEGFVLDNLSNAVLSHSRLSNYSPQFSVNENGSLRHVPVKKKK